jgi:hypothetical protein
MAAPLFTGAGVALATLFDAGGRLLVEETVEHAVDLVGAAADAGAADFPAGLKRRLARTAGTSAAVRAR